MRSGMQEDGEKADAVLGRALRQFRVARQVGKSGEEVGEGHEVTGPGIGGDAVGPMGDEWHPVPTFPRAGLDAAERASGAMSETFGVLVVPHGTVVAGKENPGIVVHACLLQAGHDLPDDLVHQHHEVAVHAGPALANEFLGREPRCVRGRQGKVEEERFLAVMVCNHLRGFLGETRSHFDVLEIR